MSDPVHIDDFRRYIEAALEHASGSHTFEDVKQAVEEGRLQFWPGRTSAVVTEIVTHPRAKFLNYFLAGGNLAELEIMAPYLEAWGRAQGCTHASLVGRRGWERTFLKGLGYEPKLVVYEKRLDVEVPPE